jgi:hypothetical protein
MKMPALALAFLCLFACANEESQLPRRLEAAIRKQIEDTAFKMNAKVALLEISALSYREVGENRLDTIRLINLSNKMVHYQKMLDLMRQQGDSHRDLSRITAGIVNEESNKASRENAKEAYDGAIAYADSITALAKTDSIIRQRIMERKEDPKGFYEAKFFCRATIGEENTLDTLIMLFDKELRPAQVK